MGVTIGAACQNCGHSNIRCVGVGHRGWAFYCSHCETTTWFTDNEITYLESLRGVGSNGERLGGLGADTATQS